MRKVSKTDQDIINEIAQNIIYKAWISGRFKEFLKLQRRDIVELVAKEIGYFNRKITPVTDKILQDINHKFNYIN